jgi:hypothetical protein
MSDNVVAHQEVTELAGRGRVNLLHFHRGMVLMVAATAVGLYRNPEAVNDPFGNGLIGYEAIPEDLQGEAEAPDGQVLEQQSGYVRLASGGVIFIRPDGVGLYPDTRSALNNRDLYWIIPFEDNN